MAYFESFKIQLEGRLQLLGLDIGLSGLKPKLGVVVVGDDFASSKYVKNKETMAKKVGIETTTYSMPYQTTQDEFVYILKKAVDENHGVIVQLPLPKHLDTTVIWNYIPPNKDADGFHPENLGKLMLGADTIEPCTPSGIINWLKFNNFEIEGKNVCIVGRSNIVGKPLAQMFINHGATVTVCHSKTENLYEHTRKADILISAVGKPKFIKLGMAKPDAVVIDVGINRDPQTNKIVGDVDPSVADLSLVTPVPNGVGLLTVYTLMENTFKLCKLQNNTNNS